MLRTSIFLTQRTKRCTPRHVIVSYSEYWNHARVLEVTGEKQDDIRRITFISQPRELKARRQWRSDFEIRKENDFNLEFYT